MWWLRTHYRLGDGQYFILCYNISFQRDTLLRESVPEELSSLVRRNWYSERRHTEKVKSTLESHRRNLERWSGARAQFPHSKGVKGSVHFGVVFTCSPCESRTSQPPFSLGQNQGTTAASCSERHRKKKKNRKQPRDYWIFITGGWCVIE